MEPNTSTKLPPEETQEVDLWLGGYSGRTMLPSFLGCGLVTGLLGWVAWLEGQWTSRLLRGVIYGMWVIQLLRWGYRSVSVTYRLTTHRLLRDRGFSHPADGEIELRQVAAVHVEKNLLERLVGVGRIVVRPEGNNSPPLVLAGVYHPEQSAALILAAVERVRGKLPPGSRF